MKKLLRTSAVALSIMMASVGMAAVMPTAAEAATAATGTQIVQTAKSYINRVEYRFNTRDPLHLIFDCSSFTQFVYKKQGIQIPWGSKAQAQLGTRVAKSSLRAGDLVFFSVGVPGKIDHVGIYVGNGKFISNTTSSDVVITDMNSGYWKNRYITARRL